MQTFILVNYDKREWVQMINNRGFKGYFSLHGMVIYFLIRDSPERVDFFDIVGGEWKYMGRWAGDRIALVGSRHKDFERIVSEFEDITAPVMNEFEKVLKILDISNIVIVPDNSTWG